MALVTIIFVFSTEAQEEIKNHYGLARQCETELSVATDGGGSPTALDKCFEGKMEVLVSRNYLKSKQCLLDSLVTSKSGSKVISDSGCYELIKSCKEITQYLGCKYTVIHNPDAQQFPKVQNVSKINFQDNNNSCNGQDQKNCPPVVKACTDTCNGGPQKPSINQKQINIENAAHLVQTKNEYTGKTSTYIRDSEGKKYLVETNEKGKSKVYEYTSDENGNLIGKKDRIRGKDAKDTIEASKTLTKTPEEQVQEVITEKTKEVEQQTQENVEASNQAGDAAASAVDTTIGAGISSADQAADGTKASKQPDANNTYSPTRAKSQAEILKCDADQASLKSAQAMTKTLQAKQKACAKSFSVAKFMCPITQSPAAQIVSTSMTALTGILSSVPTASKTCKITNSVNLSTQSVMAAGSATCFASQALCESTCQAANQLPDQINSLLSTITCDGAKAGIETVKADLAKIKVENAEKISTCAEFKKDAAQMASLAANLGAAAAQAKSCADKLEAQGGGGGSGGATVTTAQYCADPANANTSICKPGNSTMATMASIKTANTGGTSQMPGFNPATKPMSPNNANLDIGDEELNDAAGIPKTDESSASSGLTAADAASAGSAGGGSGTGGSGSATTAGNEENSTSKSVGSLFSNAVNRMFGTGGSGSKAHNKNAPIKPDYLNAAQRKLASEQLRSEISGASGTSNWDKIKNRYRSQQDSLIGN